MIKPADIVSILFGHQEQKSSVDTFIDYQYKSECTQPRGNIKSVLTDYLAAFIYKDAIQLTVGFHGDVFTFESEKQPSGNETFFSKWDTLKLTAGLEERCQVTLNIEKKVQDSNAYLVYDFGAFVSTIEDLSQTELIETLSTCFQETGTNLFFICNGLTTPCNTCTIYFLPHFGEKQTVTPEALNRPKIWEKLKSICSISGVRDCIALPDDFEIVNPGNLSNTLILKFHQCKLLLALSIVYDQTTIKDDELLLKLNGYKSFTIIKKISALNLDETDSYYKVYTWLVTGGGLQDKVGLARNLISLNLSEPPAYEIADTVYNSILSGYKVYERQNIKQYIDLRNKMSDQIISFNEKAGKIIDGFAASFQKSALAVVSLYASLILGKALSSGNPIGAFSLGATIISFSFLLISLLYFFVSKSEVKEGRQRFIDGYNNMKRRNEDLLEPEDIKEILNNDQEHLADLAFIDKKTKWYTRLWTGLLLILAIATLVVYSLNHCKPQ